MAIKKQHVDFERKILLRQDPLQCALPGAVYVPFIGDGDIAARLYGNRTIYGCDTDPARVAVASRRLKGTIIEADATIFPFHGTQEVFAVADFDAYANPYVAIESFWRNAKKADTIVLYGTDARRGRAKMACVLPLLPSGEKKLPGKEWMEAYNNWWPNHVKPWLQKLIHPYQIVHENFYLRGTAGMLYWSLIVSLNPKNARIPKVSAKVTPHRWLKGQSGNPRGRPKGLTIGEWIRKKGEELHGKNISEKEKAAEVFWQIVQTGNVQAFSLLVKDIDPDTRAQAANMLNQSVGVQVNVAQQQAQAGAAALPPPDIASEDRMAELMKLFAEVPALPLQTKVVSVVPEPPANGAGVH